MIIKYLIIHCSATRADKPFSTEALIATGMARFGQVSYHYYIRRDGTVVPTLPEDVRGVHAKGYNSCSLGICYEGGLDTQGHPADTRTEAQKASMLALLQKLMAKYPTARIIGHNELPNVAKACPCFMASKYYAALSLTPQRSSCDF
ncbi:MAG: N-acetylmuramoyl-L-alanine amidase [Bacteroidaceae bacterium]|nr:N-acetylmuramoyl-L-alanine amidase [Bacteroidaceae bacterium]